MQMNIPLSCPDLTSRERRAVAAVLACETLSLGPKLPEFEAAVAAFMNTKHAVAVNSGTSGLHLAVKAANISAGDEVITSPFSFIASANCILFERATPVFADIDPVTYNIDPACVEAAVTRRTKAILPVHVFGRPCAMAALTDIACRFNLTVIEDACEAIGARLSGKRVGTFGQTGILAFYPNKQMTTGEGGIILTADERVAELCRSWRNQGRAANGAWLQHERLGYNYRLSDINCALGIAQLQRLPRMLTARARVARFYGEELKKVPGVIPPAEAEPDVELSWFVYVVRLEDDFTQADREAVLAMLKVRGIGCNNYFSPIHLQPFYRKAFGFAPGDFPITERVSAHTIALPFFNRLSREAVVYVCAQLTEAVNAVRRTIYAPRTVAAGASATNY
jgi:perosamine synthetase